MPKADACTACANAYPPTDLTLYKPTDKLSRRYQRTWCECELEERKRKAVCRCRPVNFLRRARRTPPLKATKVCPDGNESLGLGQCRPKKDEGSCPRFKLPFCKGARTVMLPRWTTPFRLPSSPHQIPQLLGVQAGSAARCAAQPVLLHQPAAHVRGVELLPHEEVLVAWVAVPPVSNRPQ
ncbi:hypothetical protein M5D96_011503 [Drosophila gunungcola]|uniref:Uncharacterized protein n=1 Tax=Drosophila gunungcola TaxID=103775 RepID=A0A9P9YFQ3_9MUSC|nr:hypothetical protein M5D96_011503 [Drosophila gunungcola]